MADTGVSSIKSRIAALNLEQVHGPAPGTKPAYLYEQSTVKKKPPPPPPTSRPQGQRHLTVNNPPVHTHAPTTTASNTARQIANQPAAVKPDTPKISPALPPRLPPRSSPRAAPALPPRKSSEQSLSRRESVESISTISSSISTLSLGSSKTFPANRPSNGSLHQVRAPVYDPSKLPPLPPKKAPEDPKQSKATLQAMKSKITTVPKQTLPPQLPSRPPLPARAESKAQESQATSRAATVPLPPRRSALEFGMNKSTEAPPPVPTNRPSPSAASAPPPIPLSSRPNLDAIMASKPKPGAGSGCLKCRDFSGPDSHAARFPRTQLPSSDVGWLAHQLTSPFPSHTDKARTIFTWLHHNVEYDVHSFFSGTISPSTPEKTITSGLAVCEGYAGLFSALALKSGMEALVCSGDSKGFGHKPLQHGDPIPPFNCNHAWNAVRIDGGEWKLIDCCWGAGNVKCGGGGYEKKFKPSYFTMDNNEFGYKHFPQESNHQFRTDGRIMGFEEFKMDDMGGRLMVYGAASEDHGVGERTFQPTTRHLKVYAPHDAPVIRFQFATQCPHWDNERHGKGKPYVMVLHIGGRDGRSTEWIPFNTDGHLYWLDVNRIDLGAPGQKVSVYAVTSVNGQDARGLSYADYKAKKGRVAMGFGGVAMWELN